MVDANSVFCSPKRIAVLLYPGIEPMDFQGPCGIFDLWHLEEQGPEVVLVSPDGEPIACAYGRTIFAQYGFINCPEFDVLLIPGGKGRRTAAEDPAILKFLQEKAPQCQYILTVCTGIFLVAAAGLASGCRVTTHWELVDELRKDVRLTVVGEERLAQDGKLWSSAGIYSGIDLALAFIQLFEGTPRASQSHRQNEAGRVQMIAQYFPSSLRYSPGKFLQDAPEFIRSEFECTS